MPARRRSRRPTTTIPSSLDGDDNVVVGADPEHAACTSLSFADHRIVDRRTPHHPLSTSIMNPMDWNAQEGPSSMLWVSADDNIVVTVEGED